MQEKVAWLLFWGFAGPPARAEGGGEVEQGSRLRVPIHRAERLLAIDAGPKGGQIRLRQRLAEGRLKRRWACFRVRGLA